MNILRIVNEPVPSNTYILYWDDMDMCVIIDPGSRNCSSLDTLITKRELWPVYILLTHEHFDHIWGCNYLIEKYGARVICSQKCKEKIETPQNYFNKLYFNDNESYSVSNVFKTIEELDFELSFNRMLFYFIATPGHSSSSICIDTECGLFTGDTLMKGYKPLILKRHEGSKSDYKKSIEYIFGNYPPATLVYPGHGESFQLFEVQAFYEKYFGR